MDTTVKQWTIKNGLLTIIGHEEPASYFIRTDSIIALNMTQQDNTATVDIYLDYHMISLNFNKRPLLGKNKGATMASDFVDELKKHMTKNK